MYNDTIKTRYIQEKSSTTNMPNGYLARMFNKSDSFESKLDKDISNFTVYEIEDFYKTLNIKFGDVTQTGIKIAGRNINIHTWLPEKP